MLEHLNRFLKQDHHSFVKNLLIFAGAFFAFFAVSFMVLGFLGFIPTEFQETTNDTSVAAKLQESTFKGLGLTSPSSQTEVAPVKGELPQRMVASSIGLDIEVVRPTSANYVVLNSALEKGAVYYPGSGVAGKGNMFIFGHSTGYTYVNNKAFQVFNNLKNLKKGDEIKVYGDTQVYTYKVDSVKLVNANEELVSFSSDRTMLTLSTCNSFGQKTDRYVAEAYLEHVEKI